MGVPKLCELTKYYEFVTALTFSSVPSFIDYITYNREIAEKLIEHYFACEVANPNESKEFTIFIRSRDFKMFKHLFE